MIIGFAGAMYSGKDTATAYLVEKHDFKRVAFADKLKDSVACLFGIPRQWVDDYKDEDLHAYVALHGGDPDPLGSTVKRSMSWREFLQHFGTDMARENFGLDFWIEQAFRQAERDALEEGQKNLAISDVRFVNEATNIRQRNGYIVKITRPTARPGVHTSESGVPNELVDYELENTGTIEDMHKDLSEILDDIVGNS